MIPLGIYRTEKVSFKQLDPNYKASNSDLSEEASIEDEDPKLMLMDDKNELGTAGITKGTSEGLYRKKSNHKREKDGDSGDDDSKKEIKYVISNPDKDLRLKENDVVFVLA
jgi:hypothetical protein